MESQREKFSVHGTELILHSRLKRRIFQILWDSAVLL
jgi:hypothetical protein